MRVNSGEITYCGSPGGHSVKWNQGNWNVLHVTYNLSKRQYETRKCIFVKLKIFSSEVFGSIYVVQKPSSSIFRVQF